eukprot:GHVR01000692.1.p1 GENE.GHVR01000692.1~~GHVR01000692.1.p1  ORF type:complete len:175 (+),score=26.84 GHVR01000692.1:21-545(+)
MSFIYEDGYSDVYKLIGESTPLSIPVSLSISVYHNKKSKICWLWNNCFSWGNLGFWHIGVRVINLTQGVDIEVMYSSIGGIKWLQGENANNHLFAHSQPIYANPETTLSTFISIVEDMKYHEQWTDKNYSIATRNCLHFVDALLVKLGAGRLPRKYRGITDVVECCTSPARGTC